MKTIISIFLCILLALTTLVLCAAVFLKLIVFSDAFYNNVIMGPSYTDMLKDAVIKDLSAQSSYVNIPLEVLSSGIDDEMLAISLEEYFKNNQAFIYFKSEYVKPMYPDAPFYLEVEKYVISINEKEGYAPSQEQDKLLKEVSYDSAEIVEKHISMIDMDMIIDTKLFNKVHLFLYDLNMMIFPLSILTLFLISSLIFLSRKRTGTAIFYILSSYWTAGALILIPFLVLDRSGLVRRLSIKTAYLKSAIDTFLTLSNRFFIYAGGTIFISATILLLIRSYLISQVERNTVDPDK